MRRPFFKFLAGLALSFAGAGSALAQDVVLNANTDSETLIRSLRAASLTLTLPQEEEAVAQDYVAAARADYRRILTALYEAGYFGGTISILIDGVEAATLAPLDAPARINTIKIDVQTGPQFVFGQTDISPVVSETQIDSGFASGQPASTAVIKDAVRRVVDDWRNAGHAKVTPSDQKITALHPQQELDVIVTVSPGPQLTFGDVVVRGNTDVRTDRIAQIAGIPTGEVYSPKQLELAARRLRRTGTFDSVAITEADDIGPNQTLPTTITVTESKPRRIGFGIELSSIEGIRVSSFWMHRNFLGGAERFRIEGEASGIGGLTGGVDFAVRASLERPAIYGPDTNLHARAEILRLDEPDYLIDKASLEIGATRLVSDDLTIEAGFGLLTAREVTPAFSREYTLLTLPLAATLDKRNDKTNATEGYYLNAKATPFVDVNGSTLGTRIFGDARAYRSFDDDGNFVIAGRFQFGSVVGASVAETPADFLFHSGGGGTVRGQRYQALGFNQTDGNGSYRTGGLAFAGAQLEARYAVTDAISAVGFYDWGMISDSADFSGQTKWHSGVGIGVRYNTGIGPIRLDIGTPANGDDAFGSAQLYIGIGQSF